MLLRRLMYNFLIKPFQNGSSLNNLSASFLSQNYESICIIFITYKNV